MKRLLAVLPLLAFIAAASPQAAPADGAAVIKGKISYDGKPPKEKKIGVDADPFCSKCHPEGMTTEIYKISADGAVGNVFVWVKKGLEGKTYPTPKEPVVLTQAGCRYTPHVLGVQAGQPFVIRNDDDTMHNVHATSTLNGEFNFSQTTKGAETTKTFGTPELPVRFKCDVHGWMGAYVGVVAHPFFQVTGEAGTFELKGLPPGEYEIEAWHEKFGAQSQTVKIGDKETKELSFTFKGK